jgi:ubiquinone/menaquinone biosynthesis C-methylase UbiE
LLGDLFLSKEIVKESRMSWDEIYKTKGAEYVSSLDYLPDIAKMFKENNVKRIIDLGCGSGAHIVYLAGNGFEVYGVDTSTEALRVAKGALDEHGLRGDLQCTSLYEKLPYPDNYFDAVTCFRAIQHSRIANIRGAIKDIERVLRPKGLVVVTTPKPKVGRKRKVTEKSVSVPIDEPRTSMHVKGEEKGVIHYSFTKELLQKEFKNFKVKSLGISEYKEISDRKLYYYCFIGQLRK